ncbi:MAG: hypothetical protein ACXVPU_05500 [Bacteroidia bacterium]
MKQLLLIFLFASAINCFAQRWVTCKVDKTLYIQLPENYKLQDTLEQRIVSAKIEMGLIVVSRIFNKNEYEVSLTNGKELVKYYQGVRIGAIKKQEGELIKEEIIKIKGLVAEKFSYKVTVGNEKQIRHFICFYVKNRTYAAQFCELESMTDEMKVQREKLFSSIIVPSNLSIKDQMSVPEKHQNNSEENDPARQMGYFMIGLLACGFVLGILTLIIIAAWLLRRNR